MWVPGWKQNQRSKHLFSKARKNSLFSAANRHRQWWGWAEKCASHNTLWKVREAVPLWQHWLPVETESTNSVSSRLPPPCSSKCCHCIPYVKRKGKDSSQTVACRQPAPPSAQISGERKNQPVSVASRLMHNQSQHLHSSLFTAWVHGIDKSCPYTHSCHLTMSQATESHILQS